MFFNPAYGSETFPDGGIANANLNQSVEWEDAQYLPSKKEDPSITAIRKLAFHVLTQAIRDAKDPDKHPDILHWLRHPRYGQFSLQVCCALVWGREDMHFAYTVGQSILVDPKGVIHRLRESAASRIGTADTLEQVAS